MARLLSGEIDRFAGNYYMFKLYLVTFLSGTQSHSHMATAMFQQDEGI